MENQKFQIAVYVFIISILLGLFYFFIGGQILNDLKARRIEKNLSGMTLPADTELIEVTSFVGNTGNGNHVEIWAGILIHTDLDEDTLRGFFEDFVVLTVPDDLKYLHFVTFQSLGEENSAHGYYVVGTCYDAFTQTDLRGH